MRSSVGGERRFDDSPCPSIEQATLRPRFPDWGLCSDIHQREGCRGVACETGAKSCQDRGVAVRGRMGAWDDLFV